MSEQTITTETEIVAWILEQPAGATAPDVAARFKLPQDQDALWDLDGILCAHVGREYTAMKRCGDQWPSYGTATALRIDDLRAAGAGGDIDWSRVTF